MHGGDPLRAPGARVRNVAKLMVISAKTGAILSWSFVPDGAESYYSPQLLVHPDGTALVLFGTGGETHPGGLYVVALDALLSGSIKHSCRTLLIDSSKGFISPPVLVDLNADGVLDIVMSTFNASVFALDGFTFELLWKRPFPGGETYSSPAVGYFNADNVPDFAVTYQFGPGFPIYYWAEFHVLDGRNGEELLKSPVRMPIGTQSSPLTVSTFAANDVFLFWYSGCANESLNQGRGNQSSDLMDNGPYQISPGKYNDKITKSTSVITFFWIPNRRNCPRLFPSRLLPSTLWRRCTSVHSISSHYARFYCNNLRLKKRRTFGGTCKRISTCLSMVR